MNKKMSDPLTVKGNEAFYLDKDYLTHTMNQLTIEQPLESPCFHFKSKYHKLKKALHRICRFFPPYSLFWYVHTLGGNKALLPASNLKELGLDIEKITHLRMQAPLKGSYKFRRLTLKVDDLLIDAMIVGTKESLEKDRWLLFTNGNAEFYENKLSNQGFYQLLDQFKASALIFNYPGVGASTGSANRYLMRKSVIACMTFLEDSERGMGAKEIIGFGHSIGGGVQGELTLHHQFKSHVKYSFIKSRTFSSFAGVAAQISSPFSGLLVALFGWNMKTAKSSRKCKHPEIILQSALVHFYVNLKEFKDKIIHDGIIPQRTSLAYALLKKKLIWGKKSFIGIFEGHNQNLVYPEHIYEALIELWDEE